MPFRIVPRRDRKLNRLVKAGSEVAISRAEALYEPGEPADHVYLVRRGFVRLWLPAPNRRNRRVVALAGPNELFGLEAAAAGPGRRRRYGAYAGEPTVLVSLPGARAALALRTAEKTFANVMRAMLSDLSAARQLGGGRGGPTTPERLAEVLLDLVDRFGVEQGKGVLLPVRVTHQDLADLAGAHRSTVTTLLNDWIYRRALKDTPHGLVVNPETVRQRAAKA